MKTRPILRASILPFAFAISFQAGAVPIEGYTKCYDAIYKSGQFYRRVHSIIGSNGRPIFLLQVPNDKAGIYAFSSRGIYRCELPSKSKVNNYLNPFSDVGPYYQKFELEIKIGSDQPHYLAYTREKAPPYLINRVEETINTSGGRPEGNWQSTKCGEAMDETTSNMISAEVKDLIESTADRFKKIRADKYRETLNQCSSVLVNSVRKLSEKVGVKTQSEEQCLKDAEASLTEDTRAHKAKVTDALKTCQSVPSLESTASQELAKFDKPMPAVDVPAKATK